MNNTDYNQKLDKVAQRYGLTHVYVPLNALEGNLLDDYKGKHVLLIVSEEVPSYIEKVVATFTSKAVGVKNLPIGYRANGLELELIDEDEKTRIHCFGCKVSGILNQRVKFTYLQ